jgi:transposase
MRSKGSAKELEARRRLAIERINAGWKQSDVAAFLGVEERSVRRWVATYRRGGKQALASKPHPGPKAKLSLLQEQSVLGWLKQSPTQFGYATELWTAGRLCTLIDEHFGVHFNPRYLSYWLARRRITPQKPQKRPRQRNEAEIECWLRENWPELLKRGLKRMPTSS